MQDHFYFSVLVVCLVCISTFLLPFLSSYSNDLQPFHSPSLPFSFFFFFITVKSRKGDCKSVPLPPFLKQQARCTQPVAWVMLTVKQKLGEESGGWAWALLHLHREAQCTGCPVPTLRCHTVVVSCPGAAGEGSRAARKSPTYSAICCVGVSCSQINPVLKGYTRQALIKVNLVPRWQVKASLE